ncbi:hypothetical protein U2J37_27530, partial [Enterobacter hormaechei]|nr:hypothetical protein [Enterobacter hormaechei]
MAGRLAASESYDFTQRDEKRMQNNEPATPVDSSLGYTFQNDFLALTGNDSNLLIVFYVQIMPDDFVMQLHR